jgi:hypothetical protein
VTVRRFTPASVAAEDARRLVEAAALLDAYGQRFLAARS